MGKTLLLMDFENLYVKLVESDKKEITPKGIRHLLKELKTKHPTIKNDNVVIAAVWENYEIQKRFFKDNALNVLDVSDTGKNVADSYLMIDGYEKFEEIKEEIENVVLVGGDGVYIRLVRHFLNNDKEVFLYSWEKSLNSSYERLQENNDSLHIFTLEKLFDPEGSIEKATVNNYFTEILVSPKEKNLIRLVRSFTSGDIWVRGVASMMAKNEKKFPDFKGNVGKAENFIYECVNNGLFIQRKGKRGGVPAFHIRLNKSNPKVKEVLHI